jgi:hypothetical protein
MIRLAVLVSLAVAACGKPNEAPPLAQTSPPPSLPASVQVNIAAGPFLATPGRCLPNADGDVGGLEPGYSWTREELGAFSIDRDRVHGADLQRCVLAGACPGPEDNRPLEQQQRELALTTLPSAKAYCAWRHMRLPTFLEWQRAARGRYGEAYPPRWPEHSDVCPHRASSLREPFPESCSFTSADGMRYVMHSFFEWTSDEGCSPAVMGTDWAPLIVKLSEARLDVSAKTTARDMGTFRCVQAN